MQADPVGGGRNIGQEGRRRRMPADAASNSCDLRAVQSPRLGIKPHPGFAPDFERANKTLLVISDDAAVYANFSQSQKCWAHLLRKAIKLTLQEPDNQEYRQFTDRLLEIYRKACRIQRDGRLRESGLARKVAELEEELMELCAPVWNLELPPQAGVVGDYRLLVNEVMRLTLEEQLFTFVTTPVAVQPNGASQPVAGTNNEAERTLRGPATARDTGRTSKSLVGARRQTILVSVLESLRLYLPKFTLQGVMEEIDRWERAGKSCFTRLLNKLKLPCPTETILDKVLPIPSG